MLVYQPHLNEGHLDASDPACGNHVFHGKKMFNNNPPMVFPSFSQLSHCFPIIFPWLFHGFPMIFMVFQWFSHDFLRRIPGFEGIPGTSAARPAHSARYWRRCVACPDGRAVSAAGPSRPGCWWFLEVKSGENLRFLMDVMVDFCGFHKGFIWILWRIFVDFLSGFE